MKRNRNALIMAAVVLLAAAGAFAALLLWPQNADGTEPSPAPSAAERAVLVALTREEVSHISVIPPDKAAFSLANDAEAAGVSPAAQGFSYSLDAVNGYYSAALSITADKLVSESPGEQELADYGLGKAPFTECVITHKDGGTTTLRIGRLSVTGSGYYVQAGGQSGSGGAEVDVTRPVYLIPKYKGDALLKRESDFRELSFIPVYDAETEPAAQLTRVLWVGGGGSLELYRLPEEELENLEMGGSTYRLAQPYDAGCNDTVVGENVLVPIVSIQPGRVAEDNPADLAEFGLDEPITLSLTDVNGWEGTLFIGGTDPETGGRYVMLPGTTAVLLDETGDYSFLNMTPMRLRSKLFFLYNIKEVVKAESSFPDITRVLTLDDREATDTEEASFASALDGHEITETNARRIYTGMVAFMLEGELPDGAVPGELAYRQVFTMRDGRTHSMELRFLNERHLAVTVDGEALGFYVNIKHLNFLRDAYAANEAGREVPRP